MLRRFGHSIIEFCRYSDEIAGQGIWGKVRGALSTPWNPVSLSQMRQLILTEKPDILHAHNTFPLISPAIFRAARGTATATVLSLHNYRTVCASGMIFREGSVCTKCLDRRTVFPALRHGCYRANRLASLPLAAMIALHRKIGTWEQDVDAFIALTDFQKDLLGKNGLLPKEKIHVKPHFLADVRQPLAWPEREDCVIFVGRLGREKGVNFLVEAWQMWGAGAPRLKIIGDGPEKHNLERQITRANLTQIEMLGSLTHQETMLHIAKAKLLVLPSIVIEGFPMVIRESFAFGVPTIVSNIGPLPTIITPDVNGVIFESGNSSSLYKKLIVLWRDQLKMEKMGIQARVEYDSKYSMDINYQKIMEIYRLALLVRSSSSRAR